MSSQKYVNNLNRNVSPLRNPSSKPKYYSAQDVNKIVRGAFEPKIQHLMQQLEERQQVIAKLNNKLNENDEKLLQQSAIIQNYIKKHKEIPHIQSYVISAINQIINDKTKQYWETISSQIKQIGEKVQQKFDHRKLEAIVLSEMQKVKESVNQFIETNKKKSNAYWQKIKDALNKINAKITSTQKDIMDINIKLQNFQNMRMKDRQTINQLQKSKNVVKNLIQLKKSVGNIYQNYQAILSLQKGFKQRIEQQNGDSMWQEHDFFKKINTNSNSILPLPSEEFVALQYSKQFIPQPQNKFQRTQNQHFTKLLVSPIKESADKSISMELIQLQKTTPLGKSADHSQLFSLNTSNNNPTNSRIQNNTLLINLSLETRKQMCQGVRERLLQMIQAKHLIKPLQVRYDEQINYLKSSQGNYLFDLKGNMFKINLGELTKLEEEGLIIRNSMNANRKNSNSASKIKHSHC